ncbi:MAG: Xylose isomerase-like TIM barrel [Candidatus Hydrogenedentes bacterium ADurb.Bin101]|jgi:sugar phosphate isomerase/epimerase|nr:MAG: Xylose isomerase-like TIM barrel [Candidatus Hydrogenedentes bacterium ADurb.Bin101]HOC68608.1 sugar phosphate isomerase/epimerase [Candidatus Hydrogenedentota bacterium]
MISGKESRRNFIGKIAGLSLLTGVALSAEEQSSVSSGSVRLGAPVFEKSDDPELLALAHKKMRYRAAYCPDVSISDSNKIKAVSETFARHNIVIAEVGRWCNMMDADPEKRKNNLENVTEGLALAEAIGAHCCVNIAGSFSPDSWFGPHPKNLSTEFFDAAVENARKVVDAVKPMRAKFAYEMMGWSLPDSADSYLNLLKAIDRVGFGVHLDPCNIINSPDRFYRNGDIINECFDKLGPHIVSCHAKDLTWDVEMNVHFREVCPGTGAMDYTVFLKRLAGMPQQPPLMIEHLSGAEEYDQARNYILDHGQQIGVPFT